MGIKNLRYSAHSLSDYLTVTYFIGKSCCFDDARGGFCTWMSNGMHVYGYSISGFYRAEILYPRLIPQSDFQTFVKEISDSGTSTFNRKFTDEEKTFLVMKFGYPLIRTEDEDLYFKLVTQNENR